MGDRVHRCACGREARIVDDDPRRSYACEACGRPLDVAPEEDLSCAPTEIATGVPATAVVHVHVTRGRAKPEWISLSDGDSRTVGTDPRSDLVFADPATGSLRARLVCREGRLSIEVEPGHAPVTVDGKKSTSGFLAHLEVAILTPDAWIQAFYPGHAKSAPRVSDRIKKEPRASDSSPEIVTSAPCAGGCGRVLGHQVVSLDQALLLEGRLFCLPCLARVEGEFVQVDDYRILRPLAAGGMGEVHLAIEVPRARLVAFKKLRGLLAVDSESIVRFCRESRMGEKLRHPNIVEFLASGRDGGEPYLVMEYVRGKTVRELLKKKGRLDLRLALSIAWQMTKALEHAHSQKVIHRDLKPENIVCDAEGHAKLIDLGLAKEIRTSVDAGVTIPGTMMGTFHYMSPEQAQDARRADHRADIYSLGVTLFEMATGRRPFEAPGMGVVLEKMNIGDRPAVSQLLPGAPDSLERVVSRAMALRREDRYESATEMGQDLHAIAHELGAERT